MFLDYFALGLLIFRSISNLLRHHQKYSMIFPMKIAKERTTPHQDALFTSQAGLAYSPYTLFGHSYGFGQHYGAKIVVGGFAKLEEEQHDIHHRVDSLIDQVSVLQEEIAQLKQTTPARRPTPTDSGITLKIRRLSNGFTADNDLRGALHYDFQSIQYPAKQMDSTQSPFLKGDHRRHTYPTDAYNHPFTQIGNQVYFNHASRFRR